MPVVDKIAKWCPCCKAELVRRGQLVTTIKAEFVRTYMECETCHVRVMLFTSIKVPASRRMRT